MSNAIKEIHLQIGQVNFLLYVEVIYEIFMFTYSSLLSLLLSCLSSLSTCYLEIIHMIIIFDEEYIFICIFLLITKHDNFLLLLLLLFAF